MRDCAVLMVSQLTVLVPFLTAISADKLSSGQRAPVYASSAGGLSLPLPLGKSSGGAPPSEDGVVREETETFKTDGDSFIRVVTGSVGYTSPEGLPVSIKYMADENGNRASFTIGKPSGGSGGSPGRGPGGGGSGGPRPGGGSAGRGGAGGGGGGGAGGGRGGGAGKGGKDSYLPPNQQEKTYLPPGK